MFRHEKSAGKYVPVYHCIRLSGRVTTLTAPESVGAYLIRNDFGAGNLRNIERYGGS
jgi:hypothetical protein